MWLLFIILALILILGGLLILLRTAGIPKLPKNFTPKPYDDDQDDEDW